jgi:hypothetical protein
VSFGGETFQLKDETFELDGETPPDPLQAVADSERGSEPEPHPPIDAPRPPPSASARGLERSGTRRRRPRPVAASQLPAGARVLGRSEVLERLLAARGGG